jgi:hypothetical protein
MLADSYLRSVKKMKVRSKKIAKSICCKELAKELILIIAKIFLGFGKKSDLLRVKSISCLSVNSSIHRRLNTSTMWQYFGETY